MLESNKQILKRREALFNERSGPRVGDYLIRLDGSVSRFTHNWDEAGLQDGGGQTSFYLGEGYCSYSGGLNPTVPLERIEATEERRLGRVWFFNRDHRAAGNGVDFEIEFRVFKEVEK